MSDPTVQAEQKPPPKSWWHREWRLLLGLALSALCLFLAVRDISVEAIRDVVSVAKWEWTVLAIAIVVLNTFLKATRWRAMFFPQRVPLGRAWSVFVIGQMLNILLPARAGEVGRIYLIGKDDEIGHATAFSTVIVEKATDLTMLAVAYFVLIGWLTASPSALPAWTRDIGFSLLPLAAFAMGALLLLAYVGRPIWQLLRRVLYPMPSRWRTAADAAAEQAITALEVWRRWPTAAQIWGWSLLIWVLMTLTNSLVFRALQIDLPIYVALLLLVVLLSGVAAPPLPGNLGVLPYFCILILGLFGVNRETALVYGLVLQAVTHLPLIVLGLVFMFKENWPLRRSSLTSGQTSHRDAQN